MNLEEATKPVRPAHDRFRAVRAAMGKSLARLRHGGNGNGPRRSMVAAYVFYPTEGSGNVDLSLGCGSLPFDVGP